MIALDCEARTSAFRHSRPSAPSPEPGMHGNLAVMTSRSNTIAMLITTVMMTSTTGCAAVFKGSAQTVHFESVPDSADVRIDGRYAGATPVDAKVSRSSASNIVVSKEGYAPQYIPVQRHADTPWWFWDVGTCVVPITLCIPLLVDAISGAWFSYEDEVRVKLDALPTR